MSHNSIINLPFVTHGQDEPPLVDMVGWERRTLIDGLLLVWGILGPISAWESAYQSQSQTHKSELEKLGTLPRDVLFCEGRGASGVGRSKHQMVLWCWARIQTYNQNNIIINRYTTTCSWKLVLHRDNIKMFKINTFVGALVLWAKHWEKQHKLGPWKLLSIEARQHSLVPTWELLYKLGTKSVTKRDSPVIDGLHEDTIAQWTLDNARQQVMLMYWYYHQHTVFLI